MKRISFVVVWWLQDCQSCSCEATSLMHWFGLGIILNNFYRPETELLGSNTKKEKKMVKTPQDCFRPWVLKTGLAAEAWS